MKNRVRTREYDSGQCKREGGERVTNLRVKEREREIILLNIISQLAHYIYRETRERGDSDTNNKQRYTLFKSVLDA